MNRPGLLVCHECDLLQRDAPVKAGGALCCARCGAMLYRRRDNSLEHALALALGAAVLLVVSNAFPIVGLSVSGTLVQTTLFGSVRVLYLDGMWPIAALVFVTTILMPILQTATMLWLLLPLRWGGVPPLAAAVFRICRLAGPWGMVEVLILGLLVSLVKLSHIASVVVGVAMWSFGALMLVLAAAGAAFDARALWARIDALHPAPASSRVAAPLPSLQHGVATGARCGLALCHDCGQIARLAAGTHGASCPRCGAAMHVRKPDSLSRTWALLVASAVLYVPANVMPVMYTSSLFGAQKDTILSGVVYLWTSGSAPLAIIVFIASIAVPMLKILALVYLTLSAQLRVTRQTGQRARIYRIVEFVGRWSMLDIYVITMLVALVQFKSLATIQAGPASIAFGAVVVLTMFAAMSFDPRLTWDAVEQNHARFTTDA